MSPLPKILAAVVVLAVLGGGGFFAWKKFGKGAGTGDGVVSTEAEYQKRFKKMQKDGPSALDNLRLALWCKSVGYPKYEFHLKEAAKMSPGDGQVRAGLSEFYWTRASEKPPASAADLLAAAEEAKQAGMEGEKRRLARRAAALEPENAAAWELLGCVKYEHEGVAPRWMTKTEAEKAKAADVASEAAKEKVKNMSERDKRSMELKQGIQGEFGNEIQFIDEKPFLFCMQKDPSYNTELVLSGYMDEFKAFYGRFYERYGDKFKLGDLSEQVMLIFIFKSRIEYHQYGANHGVPANAGGHWEPDNERLMIFHSPPTEIDRADPYGTIFHETTHMIVTFATKLRGKPSGQMFWFTEGLATYFEPFERDKATGKIKQLVGTINGGRITDIKQWLSKSRHVKLKELLGWSYVQFAQQNFEHIQKKDGNWGAYCYAEAWSVLYFFYNYDSGKYAAKFEQYFEAELNGSPGMDTFKKIFGEDFDTMETEWSDFTKSLK